MEIKLFFCFGLSVFFDCGSFLDLDINLAKLNLFMVEFYVGLLGFDLYSHKQLFYLELRQTWPP